VVASRECVFSTRLHACPALRATGPPVGAARVLDHGREAGVPCLSEAGSSCLSSKTRSRDTVRPVPTTDFDELLANTGMPPGQPAELASVEVASPQDPDSNMLRRVATTLGTVSERLDGIAPRGAAPPSSRALRPGTELPRTADGVGVGVAWTRAAESARATGGAPGRSQWRALRSRALRRSKLLSGPSKQRRIVRRYSDVLPFADEGGAA
jgi:hypothetical protein